MPTSINLGSNVDPTKNITLEADGTGQLVIKNTAGTTLGTIDGSGNLVLPGTISGSNATQTGELITFDQAFGLGQTWQNLVGSRALGATYTNTTNKTIFVSVVVQAGAGATYIAITANVSGVTRQYMQTVSTNSANRVFVSVPVPPGGTYAVIGDGNGAYSLEYWHELRD